MERDKTKVYTVTVIEENTETGELKKVMEEKFAGFALTADCGDGKCCEVVINDSIIDIAGRMAQGEKLSEAAKAAFLFMKLAGRKYAEDTENALIRAIMGE